MRIITDGFAHLSYPLICFRLLDSPPDGQLKAIPTQRKKLEVVLRFVVQAFELDVRNTEKQVNEILSRFYDDVAGLRRELIGFDLMGSASDGGEYWRVEK